MTTTTALSSGAAPLTMSSVEIAELTGKEHRNVMRDIRTMLTELFGAEGVLSSEHTHRNAQNGLEYPIFHLPKNLTITLVSGCSVALRARIVDRWIELEGVPAGAFIALNSEPLKVPPAATHAAHNAQVGAQGISEVRPNTYLAFYPI